MIYTEIEHDNDVLNAYEDGRRHGHEQGVLDGIDEFVKILEKIDSYEFAMFSLWLIKETAERLKEKKNGEEECK